MTTSNSYDFDLIRNQIIKAALRKLNAIDQFEEPSAAEINDGAEALNVIVKAWQSQGGHLFKYEEIIVFLERNKTLYTLGSTGDNAALSNDVIETTTNNSSSTGGSTISVTSIVGLVSGDFIGIELSNGTSQWTTISGAPSGNTVTLSNTLTSGVSSGAQVYSYTTKIQKPMRIVDARRRTNPITKTDIIVQIVARERYFELPNKASEGMVTQIHYNPKINKGNLYVWQSPSDVITTIRATTEYPIEDFDTSVNTPDLPNEWLRALIFSLAVDLAPEYGNINDQTFQIVKQLADEYKSDALDYDVEYTNLQIVPGFDDSSGFGR